jgi:hypothetical protein
MPKRLILCLIRHHAIKTYWRSGGIIPRIFDLGTREMLVVSFMLRLLYPRFPLYSRLGGSQIQSGKGGEEKSLALRYIPNPFEKVFVTH